MGLLASIGEIVVFGILALFVAFVGVLLSELVKRQRLKHEAIFLILQYLDPEAYEKLERALTSSFEYFVWQLEWESLRLLIHHNLDEYDPDKDVIFGMMLLGDEAVAKYPVPHSSGRYTATQLLTSAHAERIVELDRLIESHLDQDIRQQYPKEVYYLRVNLLRDYVPYQNNMIYDGEDAGDWGFRDIYCLADELPLLHFCKHVLNHLHEGPRVEFDRKRVRERFAQVHAEFQDGEKEKVGGSWLRRRRPPRDSY